jgi:hypothetical protein
MKCALLLALYVGEADAVTAVDVAREPDGPLFAVGRPVHHDHRHAGRQPAVIVVAVIVALAGVVLVSLASKREDSAQSLSGRPSGRLEAVARSILGFHGDGIACRPAAGQARPRGQPRARRDGDRRDGADRHGAVQHGAGRPARRAAPRRLTPVAQAGRLRCPHASRFVPVADQLRAVGQPRQGRGGRHQRRCAGGPARRLSGGHTGAVLG